MACARPISPPSVVTAELLDMFCALNGATLMPLRANSRHSPATTIDLPASDVVPATSSAPLIFLRRADVKPPKFPIFRGGSRLLAGKVSQLGQDLRAIVGDHQRVLELRGPLLVLGGDGPAVVPDLVVQRAEVDHRLDGERHAWLQHGFHGGLVVVQHDQPVVEGGADAVAGEVANYVVAEAVCIRLDDPPDDGQLPAWFDGLDRADGSFVGALDEQTVLLGHVA